MNLERIIHATAVSLYELYRLQFALMEPAEDASGFAGTAVERYLMNCGLDLEAAVRIRDEVMLGIDPA